MKRTVVVILARAGSVRLPRKNVAMFDGRPMIAWTFDRALALRDSGLAEQIVVSTDDAEVQSLAPAGIEVIARPPELATATATSFDAMAHAVSAVESRSGPASLLVLLQPTSPLASAASTVDLVRLAAAAAIQDRMAFVSVASLVEGRSFRAAPGWRLAAKGNGVRPFAEVPANAPAWPLERVSDEQATHVLTGATYAVPRDVFFRDRTFLPSPPRTVGVVVAAHEAIDIDTAADFSAAAAVAKDRGAASTIRPTARVAAPATQAATTTQQVNDITRHLRKGELSAAAQILSQSDGGHPELEKLAGRLVRLCAQAIGQTNDAAQLTALIPIVVQVSPPNECAPAIATSLASRVQRELETAPLETVEAWLAALAPLLAERRIGGPLLDAVLDLIDRQSEPDGRKDALASIAARWRETGYDGLSDDRLTRLAGQLSGQSGDVSQQAT